MNKSSSIKKKILSFLLSVIPLMILLGLETITAIPLGMMDWTFTLGGKTIQLYNILSLICYAAAFVLCGIWYYQIRKRRDLSGEKSFDAHLPVGKRSQTIFSGNRKSMLLILLSLVLAAVGLQFVTRVIVVGITSFFPNLSWVYQMLSDGGGSNLTVLYVINIVILAPLAEETAFRGVTLHYARKVMPFWLANLWQALLFGICHTSLVKGAYAFVLGIVFGYFCRKSYNIQYSIPAHMLVNLIAIFSSDLIVTCYDGYFVLSAIFGILVTIFAMWLFSKE